VAGDGGLGEDGERGPGGGGFADRLANALEVALDIAELGIDLAGSHTKRRHRPFLPATLRRWPHDPGWFRLPSSYSGSSGAPHSCGSRSAWTRWTRPHWSPIGSAWAPWRCSHTSA